MRIIGRLYDPLRKCEGAAKKYKTNQFKKN